MICAPVYSARHGLSSQVPIGIDEGLRHDRALHCDELVSLPKQRLTAFVGRLSGDKLRELDHALIAALDMPLEGGDESSRDQPRSDFT